MVETRSSVRIVDMSVSQEIREYFSELVRRLVTNKIWEDMFKKLNEEIISKSEEKIDEQNRKIDKLEGKIAIQANTIDQLIIKCDDNEQYSRLNYLRIHWIEFSDDERNNDVFQRVRECYEEMNLPFQLNILIGSIGVGRPTQIKTLEKKSNPSLLSLFLGNLANNFIMQDRSISPIVNGNQVTFI